MLAAKAGATPVFFARALRVATRRALVLRSFASLTIAVHVANTYTEIVALPIFLRHVTIRFFLRKENLVNKDQVEGRVEQAKGKVAEIIGKVIDDDRAMFTAARG